jgi:hypothetical protein
MCLLLLNEERILSHLCKDTRMTQQPSKEDMLTIEELVVSHSYEMLGLITVLEKKGILSRAEIIDEIQKMKVQQSKLPA